MAEGKYIPPDTIRHAKKKAMLVAYGLCGGVRQAAAKAKIHHSTHYTWLQEDADYKAAFDDVQEFYCEKLEAEADRRATEGTDEPVFYEGVECGSKKRFSDTLLIFRLKGLKPEKYRERIEQTGKFDHTISADVRQLREDLLSADALLENARTEGPHTTNGHSGTFRQNGHG